MQAEPLALETALCYNKAVGWAIRVCLGTVLTVKKWDVTVVELKLLNCFSTPRAHSHSSGAQCSCSSLSEELEALLYILITYSLPSLNLKWYLRRYYDTNEPGKVSIDEMVSIRWHDCSRLMWKSHLKKVFEVIISCYGTKIISWLTGNVCNYL